MLLDQILQGQNVYFQLARFLITIIVGFGFTKLFLMPSTRRLLDRRGSDKKAKHSIENVVGLIGFFLTVTVALQVADFGSLVTLLGTIAAAATVAIGFGMRDQVANIVAGVFIHTDNPFVKGDYVKVNDTEGTVQDVKLRATILNGGDKKKQVVPNSMLTTNVVQNYTKGSRTKTSIETMVKPKNIEEASQIFLEIASNHEGVLKKPEPSVHLDALEEDKLKVQLNYWVKDAPSVKQVRSEMLEEYAKKAQEKGFFDKEKEKEE